MLLRRCAWHIFDTYFRAAVLCPIPKSITWLSLLAFEMRSADLNLRYEMFARAIDMQTDICKSEMIDCLSFSTSTYLFELQLQQQLASQGFVYSSKPTIVPHTPAQPLSQARAPIPQLSMSRVQAAPTPLQQYRSTQITRPASHARAFTVVQSQTVSQARTPKQLQVLLFSDRLKDCFLTCLHHSILLDHQHYSCSREYRDLIRERRKLRNRLRDQWHLGFTHTSAQISTAAKCCFVSFIKQFQGHEDLSGPAFWRRIRLGASHDDCVHDIQWRHVSALPIAGSRKQTLRLCGHQWSPVCIVLTHQSRKRIETSPTWGVTTVCLPVTWMIGVDLKLKNRISIHSLCSDWALILDFVVVQYEILDSDAAMWWMHSSQ
jgi:hypothetical protein